MSRTPLSQAAFLTALSLSIECFLEHYYPLLGVHLIGGGPPGTAAPGGKDRYMETVLSALSI